MKIFSSHSGSTAPDTAPEASNLDDLSSILVEAKILDSQNRVHSVSDA